MRCDFGGWRKQVKKVDNLRMDGPGILTFTLNTVPRGLNQYLKKEKLQIEEFESVIFHQANKFILERLYAKCAVRILE